jgi:hypothetical protein
MKRDFHMRSSHAAAVLAALFHAAPAAAQPHGGTLMVQAMERLAHNVGPHVRDYSFTLVHDGLRTPVYVVRDASGEWSSHVPDVPLADVVRVAVWWPAFTTVVLDAETMDSFHDEVVYVREEVVDGRRAHLLSIARYDDLDPEDPTALLYHVDSETAQVLRVRVRTALEFGVPEEGWGTDAYEANDIVLSDYRETGGLVIPRRMHLRSAWVFPNMDPSFREELVRGIERERPELRHSRDPEHLDALALGALVTDGFNVQIAVEDVVVNPGPPDWLDATES